jgi:hypothetical protein
MGIGTSTKGITRGMQKLEDATNKGIDTIQTGEQDALSYLRDALLGSQENLNPYGAIGNNALKNISLLSDPAAQQEFLQNNQIFQNSMQNVNNQINSNAAARGRLSSGDTMLDLNNASANLQNQFLNQERQNIFEQLGFGAGIAGQQNNLLQNFGSNAANLKYGTGNTIANMLTDMGSAEANSLIAKQNQKNANSQAAVSTILSAASMFSDVALKDNIKEIGKIGNFKKYSWNWNKKAEKLGLTGYGEGVIAQEVEKTNPELIINDATGYKKVRYGEI